MCYACSPLCGGCKPKRIVAVECPECGAPASMSRDEYLLFFRLPHRKSVVERRMEERGGIPAPACPVCGESLVEAFEAAVQPKACRRQGIVCGYPCGRAEEDPPSGGGGCPFVVPMGKAD